MARNSSLSTINTLLPIDELPANPDLLLYSFSNLHYELYEPDYPKKYHHQLQCLREEPLSIVLLQPISTSLPIMTDPM